MFSNYWIQSKLEVLWITPEKKFILLQNELSPYLKFL